MANYSFRSLLGVLHFVVAYLTYHEDSDATRAHDKYIYMHAAIVVLSIGIEISMSTIVKIRRRGLPAENVDIPSENAMDVRNSIMTASNHYLNGEDEEDDEEVGRSSERMRSRRSAASSSAASSSTVVKVRSSLSSPYRKEGGSKKEAGLRESLLEDDQCELTDLAD